MCSGLRARIKSLILQRGSTGVETTILPILPKLRLRSLHLVQHLDP
jgi:hypothetical protein